MSNDTTPPLKRCTKCGEEKPATTEYFYSHSRNPIGLNPQCKDCCKIRAKASRDRHIDEHRRKARERAYDLYHSDENYREKVKEQARSRMNEKYKTNPEFREREIARSNANYQENSEMIRAREQKRMSNPLKIQERREYDKARGSTRARKNQINLTHSRRRARLRKLPDTFTQAQRQLMLEYWSHSCCVCGQPRDFWHIISDDHWIPINSEDSDNPGTSFGNMLPMCHTIEAGMGGCNNSKGAKNGEEWLKQKFGKKKAAAILARVLAYFEWVKTQE